MSEKLVSDESRADDPLVSTPDDDAGDDRVDGEAVVVPGQRPGPAEPAPS